MTCREAKILLKGKGGEGHPSAGDDALALHLKSCPPCGEAMKIANLSSALFQALRDESEPGPAFYHRLRARLAESENSRPDMGMLHAWVFARRLIPALAMGVLLLAGVTLSSSGSQSPQPVQGSHGEEMHAFSLEEVNLPGVVGQPSRDQMLAFVLRQDDVRGFSRASPPPVGESRGEGEVRDGSDDRDTR